MNCLKSLMMLSLLGAVAHSLAQTSAQPASLALSGQDLSAGSPSARIYRSGGRDGEVSFGDQPPVGAQSIEIRSYAPASDARSMELARQQREYWRGQSQAFEARQLAREREVEEQRQDSILAKERERLGEVPTRIYSNGPNFYAGPSVPPMPKVSPVYSSSPGAPGGAGAGFIGSGFATMR